MDSRFEMGFAGEEEGARRATGSSPAVAAPRVPDPAVDAKPQRRRFTAEYKLRILREVERAKGTGEVGAILRREGLYSSHLVTWRRERDHVAKAALSARRRGPKRKVEDPRIKQLEREMGKLRRHNQRLEAMLEIQKKASELLGIPLSPLEPDESD
jgi:transposase-like protein